MNLAKHLRKQGIMDETYNIALLRLESVKNSRSAPRKQKIHTNKAYIRGQDADYALALRHLMGHDHSYGAVGQREPKKRKRKGNVKEQTDDSYIQKINPQNKLFLRHSEEGDRGSESEEQHFYPEQRLRNLCERNMVRSQRKLKGDHVHSIQLYDRLVKNESRHKTMQPDRINAAQIDKSNLCEKSGRSKRVQECPLEHADKAQSNEKNRGKKAAAAKRKEVVLISGDHFHHKRAQEKTLRERNGLEPAVQAQSVEKCLVKEEVKEEHGNCEETDLLIKGMHGRIRSLKHSELVPAEVEILDSDMVVNKRILSPFVPNQLHCSLLGDESKNNGVFREEVLKAIRKPYDKVEHQNLRKIMQDGSYIKHDPGLRRILAKFKYQRVQRLIIIRGFLFWLQNLTREGAFRPWEDEECLAVDILNRKK